MIGFGLIIKAGLVVAGILWCREMFSRFRSDIEEFRSSGDRTKRSAIILLWSVTAVIIVLMVSFLWSLLRNLL